MQHMAPEIVFYMVCHALPSLSPAFSSRVLCFELLCQCKWRIKKFANVTYANRSYQWPQSVYGHLLRWQVVKDSRKTKGGKRQNQSI